MTLTDQIENRLDDLLTQEQATPERLKELEAMLVESGLARPGTVRTHNPLAFTGDLGSILADDPGAWTAPGDPAEYETAEDLLAALLP